MTTVYYPVLWLVIAGLAVALFAVTSGLDLYWRRLEMESGDNTSLHKHIRGLKLLRNLLYVIVGVMVTGGIAAWTIEQNQEKQAYAELKTKLLMAYQEDNIWESPDWLLSERDPKAKLIAYGRDLVANTNDYFGQNGIVRPHSINGLNCQNCHLDAGTKAFGNNYSAVASTYPRVRARSGELETIPKRINDCFERSLNGQPLDTTGKEMKAMVAYMEWLGLAVPKGQKPKGGGLPALPYLDRPADPEKGRLVFEAKCASCHGADGQGLPMPGTVRDYPPLWGPESYNQAAGLFRLSRFASYVKANMPLGASYLAPQLTDEEAWDVAAFVNSQPRPEHPFLDKDWPDVSKKPLDHPFGPYADPFSEQQHKFGPFEPIAAFYQKQ